MSAVTRNEAGFVLSHASSCLIPGRTHIWTVITNNCTQFLKHSSNFFSSFSKNQIQPFHMDIVDSFFSQDQKVGLGNGKKVWVHFHSRAHLSQVLPGGWWARLESFTSLSSGSHTDSDGLGENPAAKIWWIWWHVNYISILKNQHACYVQRGCFQNL